MTGAPSGGAGAGPPLAPPSYTLRRELARKAIHLTSVVAPLVYAAGMPRAAVSGALIALAAAAVVLEVARARIPAVSASFERALGALLRPRELTHWTGATWMLISFAGAAAFLPPRVAIAAMWAVAVGDASAAVIGRAVGRLRTAAGKSLEGAIACFAVSLGGAFWLAGLTLGESVAGALGAALAELPTRPFDDNIRIVLGAAGGILLWGLLLS